MKYETVIGLEIHVQLNTRSKLFCSDPVLFGAPPNTQVSPVSLAHPGTLPYLNRTAVEYAVRLGLALGSTIDRASRFDRKNYFYPDLPKGYQITQDRRPICVGGQVLIGSRTIRIHHIHLEEDAGKSIHDQHPIESWIDLNRAGVPLLEIVTEPDLRSAEETALFMEEIRRLVRWIGISDGNMEEGSLRCDVNISLRPEGSSTYGERCELKNMNSMRFAKKAIQFEQDRQLQLLKKGETIPRQTRGFDPESGQTYAQRDKEEAHDYRYFPEPDLPPVLISEEWFRQIQTSLPILPRNYQTHFEEDLGMTPQEAQLLCQERRTAEWVKQASTQLPAPLFKWFTQLIIQKILPWCAENGQSPETLPVPLSSWRQVLELIQSEQISASAAYQKLVPAVLANPQRSPEELAEQLELLHEADEAWLATIIDEVLQRFPDKVKEYQKGKKNLIGLFMGEVMRISKGKAEPKSTQQLLQKKLLQEK
ncbi:MAG: Asp-tRNA(Asn)/Glu-tRNA(Gln) amidotransferase subunit GatB [Chitinophagales bacterium]